MSTTGVVIISLMGVAGGAMVSTMAIIITWGITVGVIIITILTQLVLVITSMLMGVIHPPFLSLKFNFICARRKIFVAEDEVAAWVGAFRLEMPREMSLEPLLPPFLMHGKIHPTDVGLAKVLESVAVGYVLLVVGVKSPILC